MTLEDTTPLLAADEPSPTPDPSSSGTTTARSRVSLAGLDRVEGRGGLDAAVTALAAASGVATTLAESDDEEES